MYFKIIEGRYQNIKNKYQINVKYQKMINIKKLLFKIIIVKW